MEITEIDNRGDDEVPFGFVYFKDNTRIAYAKNGDTWQFSGSGSNFYHSPTIRHELAAKEHLEQHGPTVPKVQAAA